MPITVDDIRPLYNQAKDIEETQELINLLRELREVRNPFYLTAEEFDRILHWKLRQQYGRQTNIRALNNNDIIKKVTGLALTITHNNEKYELELRLNILRALRGVETSVASAVLALVYPEKYCVIDFRGWRQVFDEEREQFTVNQYKRYWIRIKEFANELNWTPQKVDLAIWEYDQRQNN